MCCQLFFVIITHMGNPIPPTPPESPIGNDCQYCPPGTTPQFITMTVAGFPPCGCVPIGDGSWLATDTWGQGTYFLTQSLTDPCVWEGGGTWGDTIETYAESSDCTGEAWPSTEANDVELVVILFSETEVLISGPFIAGSVENTGCPGGTLFGGDCDVSFPFGAGSIGVF